MPPIAATTLGAGDIAKLEFGPNLWWQAPLLFVLTIAASSAGAVVAKRILPSRSNRVRVQRDGAAEALDALHEFYVAVNKYNAIARALTEIEERELLTLGSKARMAAAKTGDDSLNSSVRDFVHAGRRWAVRYTGTTADGIERRYDDLITAITSFLHRNR